MKRRSFLALLGLAPVMPLAVQADDGWQPMPELTPWTGGDPTFAKCYGWHHDQNAWVWIHSDRRFVTDKQLAESGITSPEEYCAVHNITVLPPTGDYNRLSNGMAMHHAFPERITRRG